MRRVVYRLSDLKGRSTILICEGEKDVDAAWARGVPATCNSGGAGKWTATHTEQLVTAGVNRVYIIPDDDEPGRRHAEIVAQSSKAAGMVVKLVPLPAKDLAAFFEGGGTVDDLRGRIKDEPGYVTCSSHAVTTETDRPAVPLEHAVSSGSRQLSGRRSAGCGMGVWRGESCTSWPVNQARASPPCCSMLPPDVHAEGSGLTAVKQWRVRS